MPTATAGTLKRMPPVPREPGLDHTLALLRDGYTFIIKRCEKFGSDIFETRLMLRPVICIRGASAAEFFYTGDHFTRVRAMPITVLRLLQDYGSVQLLDGAEHRVRKAMFMTLGSPDAAAQLSALMRACFEARLAGWEATERIVLFDEIRAILTEAALAFAAIPADAQERKQRTTEFSEMIESTGGIGPRLWRALLLRRRSERWARQVIEDIRAGRWAPPADSPAAIVAAHRDAGEVLLDVPAAAVELLNLVRPVNAVARFIVFAALALHRHKTARQRIREGDEAYLHAFVEEVRRTTPFFPFTAGRACEELEWHGHVFEPGQWVLLDLYGTDHDPAIWDDPHRFRPERFLERTPSLFEFVPQGAGEPAQTHRCPGERLTTELMKGAVRLLTRSVRYDVPEQDFTVDLARIPAIPNSRFVMTNVQRMGPDR